MPKSKKVTKPDVKVKVAKKRKAAEPKKAAKPKKKAKRIITKDMIAEAAYYKAEMRGFNPGYEEYDWIEAEKELSRN